MMNILPPEPPLKEEELNGTFLYIKSISDREMFYTAYKAITITETWNTIKNMKSIYNQEYDIIYKKIEELGYCGHSGCSFMCTLREMQFIAIYGEKKFKDRYDEYQNKALTDIVIKKRRLALEQVKSEMLDSDT